MYELLDQHVMFEPTILDEFPNLKVTILYFLLLIPWQLKCAIVEWLTVAPMV